MISDIPFTYFYAGATVLMAACILKRSGPLAVAKKGGIASVGMLLAACFLYGLFNGSGMGHIGGPPGFEGGAILAVMMGGSFGPFVFIVGALSYTALRYFRRRHEQRRGD